MSLSFEDGLRRLVDILEEKGDTVEASTSSSNPSTSSPITLHPNNASSFAALAAGKNDEEDEDDSSIIAKQLLSVTLDKDVKQNYTKFFFDRRSAKFVPLYEEIINLSARFNGFLALLRYGLTNARRLALMDKVKQAEIFNSQAERILGNVTGDHSEALKTFLDVTKQGNSHVIKPSTRFEGGFDFDFIGALNAPQGVMGSSSSLYVPYNENNIQDLSPHGKENDTYYKTEYLEAYATELSQGLINAGIEIMSMVTGEDSVNPGSATKRVTKVLPLTFDFGKLNDIFFDHTGLVLTVDFMKGIDTAIAREFSEFLSVIAIRTPKRALIDKVNNKMRDNKRKASLQSEQEGKEVSPDVIEMNSFMDNIIHREGLALSQIVSFSFSISMPENIARYIAQAKDNEPISMLSLHNWVSVWSKRYVKSKGATSVGERLKGSNIPKVVLPLSKAQNLTELRVKNDFSIEGGKGDDNGIFIGPDGSLNYGLRSDQAEIANNNLKNYENDMEEFLSYCFEQGIPAHMGVDQPIELRAVKGDYNTDEEFKERKAHIASYSGKLLSYNWDYNNVIVASPSNPTNMKVTNTVGAAKVDDLTMADYLGMDFAKPGEDPIRKSFAESMILMLNHPLKDEQTSADVIGTGTQPYKMVGDIGEEDKSFLGPILSYYKFSMLKERVPNQEALIKEAAQELGIAGELSDLQQQISYGVINSDLTADRTYSNANAIDRFLASCVRYGTSYAVGNHIMRSKVSEENPGIDSAALRDLIREDPDYFNPSTSPAGDFGRLYRYLPGAVFKIAMQHLIELDPKDILSIESAIDLGYMKMEQPNYSVITKKILPLASMFAKYIPDSENIMERAESLRASNIPDESISEQDIRVSGGVDSAQMFPHQIKTHQALRGHPKFAILDIAPGGGKTSIGVTDIGCLATEIDEISGPPLRPLILCPDGLIKNWVNDMKIFTKNKWNMVPINSKIINRWGYERLDEILKDAPVNTIVVAGFFFLKAKIETISIGTHQTKVSNNLEFIKRYGFDYICIDESHKLKSKKSSIHNAVKQLTTASNIRYLRLATGTLINNVVSDIVGQTALYNGHIFRDGEVKDTAQEEEIVRLGTDVVPLWKVDTPQRARQKLSQYASVTTLKKREWSFMLPSPVEKFFKVPMVPMDDPNNPGQVSEKDVELGELHQQLYDAVIKESEDELQKLVDKVKGMTEAQIEARDEKDASTDDGTDVEDIDFEMEEGDDFMNISMKDLDPYLQRIERLLTNPMADPLAPQIFGPAGITSYDSTKARFIASRIDDHFNPPVWNKDTLYKEYTFVSHDGRYYLARKLDKASSTPKPLPEETKGKSPNIDVDTWKEETEGKVIVFCRYTNSANGVYNALPSHYKKMAVKYTGEEDNKLANLDAFLTDPNIKILVANEQGIMEGHNMQMASRIIRVESPWAPGDLDQANSRIFRPDPKAAQEMIRNGKPGELAREAIFLDWVMCDNSMEVPKQARLIAKTVRNAGFDESENPLYQDVLEDYGSLPNIRMGMDLLRSRASFDDYSDYVEGYATFKAIQREEFHDMRVNNDFSMRNLEAQPEIKGSKKIRTPFVSNQQPNEDELGLVTLRNVLRNPDHANLLQNIDKLKGLPVVTDMGPGRIATFRVRYKTVAVLDENGQPTYTKKANGKKGSLIKERFKDENGNFVVDADNPISSITVKSSETQEAIPTINDIGSLYLVTKDLSPAEKKRFKVNSLAISDAQIRKEKAKIDNVRKARDKALQKEEDRKLIQKEKARRKAAAEAKAARAAKVAAKKRKENIKKGKPINAGVKRVAKVPKVGGLIYKEDVTKEEETDKSITLHPALYHGYLTLELKSEDPDAMNVRKHGFKSTGPFAAIDIKRFNQYEKVFDYIEDNFVLGTPAFNRLDEVAEAFEAGARGIYNMSMVNPSTLKYFFTIRKQKVTNSNEIRPYAVVMPTFLRIAVDITTNPAIRKHIGKSVTGASAKWTKHEGYELFFAKNKTALKSKVKELKQAGFTIENEKALMKEITSLKFRAPKKKK